MQFDVDGRSAYAYTGGRPFDPTRPVVVFVHGAQHDHSVWILQTRHLAHHGFSVLAFDLPGHGRSAGPALTDVESMAGWVLRAVRAAGAVRAAAIVGHSMGSLIALEAAGQAPEAVGGIAMVGTAFPMKVSDVLLDAARDDEPAAFDMINQWSHARLVHRPGTPGPGFSVFVQNLRLMERQPPGVLRNDFAACNAYGQGLERATALRCPALMVLGERDAMTPPRAAAGLIGAIRDARVTRVPGCGHAIMTEAPDALREALDGWLRDAVLRPSGSPT
ncbi:MAG: alpha/beta fold hydrolase [Burkholderiales bacterium]|nr:MAG: alpha/beta fold hydrolase [Burkholderiales bacterium]